MRPAASRPPAFTGSKPADIPSTPPAPVEIRFAGGSFRPLEPAGFAAAPAWFQRLPVEVSSRSQRYLVANEPGDLLARALYQLGGGLVGDRTGRVTVQDIGHAVLLSV